MAVAASVSFMLYCYSTDITHGIPAGTRGEAEFIALLSCSQHAAVFGRKPIVFEAEYG
jgi:hypothetical protein